MYQICIHKYIYIYIYVYIISIIDRGSQIDGLAGQAPQDGKTWLLCAFSPFSARRAKTPKV